MYKAGYLGPSGSYSSLAVQKLCKDAEQVVYLNFRSLFSALKAGDIDVAVIPIENTVNGAVTQNLDLLEETDGVIAVGSCEVEIDHRLITLKGAEPKSIKKIYSHPQALGQCSKYLAENYPDAKLYNTSSTAESVEMLKDTDCAGIVGAHMQVEGCVLGGENLSDEKNNRTRFLKVVRGGTEKLEKANEVFFSFTCKHEAGALCKALEVISRHGLNMTKIESRPIKNRCGEFRFFIEIEADYAAAIGVLDEIKKHCLSLKILGAY